MEASSSKTKVEPVSTWYLHMMPDSHMFYIKWDGRVLLKLSQEPPEKPARPKKNKNFEFRKKQKPFQPYTWKSDDVTENFWPKINVETNVFIFLPSRADLGGVFFQNAKKKTDSKQLFS